MGAAARPRVQSGACRMRAREGAASLKILVLLSALVGLLFTTGCSDEQAASCSSAKDCARGAICGSGSQCEEKVCESSADCGINNTCIPDENRCTAIECTFAEDCDEAAGESCEERLCVKASSGGCASREDCAATNQVCNLLTQKCVAPPTNCSSENDCVSPQSCDSTTRVCSGAATTCATDAQCSANQYCDTAKGACAIGCRADGCEAGKVCDTTSRACIEATVCTASECEAQGGKACDSRTGQCVERSGSVTLCGACTPGSTTECGAPGVDRCTPLGPDGGRCVYSCQESTDCPNGFSCIQLTSSPDKFCAPLNGKCQGCLIDGCPDNQVCNPTGSCTEPKALCEECAPGLCAAGTDCGQLGNSARCLDLCDGGCPAGSTCDTASNLCKPDSGSCQTAACPGVTCSGATPYLNEQTCTCVACLDSSQCGGNQCNAGVCSSCACPPGTECGANNACIPTGGGCTNCPAGTSCDTLTQTCYTPGSCTSDSDCRTTCGSLFPVCICTGDTDTTSCRPDEMCIGAELFPGVGAFGCFGGGGGFP
jgi:hypothetical protein